MYPVTVGPAHVQNNGLDRPSIIFIIEYALGVSVLGSVVLVTWPVHLTASFWSGCPHGDHLPRVGAAWRHYGPAGTCTARHRGGRLVEGVCQCQCLHVCQCWFLWVLACGWLCMHSGCICSLDYFPFHPVSGPWLIHQRLWYVLACLWESAYKRSLVACWKEYPMWRQLVFYKQNIC